MNFEAQIKLGWIQIIPWAVSMAQLLKVQSCDNKVCGCREFEYRWIIVDLVQLGGQAKYSVVWCKTRIWNGWQFVFTLNKTSWDFEKYLLILQAVS